MSTLKYLLDFQSQGLGNVQAASAAIDKVANSAGPAQARVQAMGQALQASGKGSAQARSASGAIDQVATSAGPAQAKVQGFSQALQSIGRVAGFGPLAEVSGHLERIADTAGQAGGKMGMMLRVGGYIGIAVAAYSALQEKIAAVSREIDQQIDSTKKLSRAANDTATDGRKGLGKIETTEDRDSFVEDAEAKKKQLVRDFHDTTSMKDKASIQAHINTLNILIEQAGKMDLKTRAQIESFKQSQADTASKAELMKESGRDRTAQRDSFAFEKTMSETPDTKAGAEQRIQLILTRQDELQGRNNRKGAEIVGAERSGSPEELSRLLAERATIEAEQNNLTLQLIEEHKRIGNFVTQAKKEELKDAEETRRKVKRESRRIERELVKDSHDRLDDRNLPKMDNLAKRGINVVGGGASDGVRWQKASADALGKLVALTTKIAAARAPAAAATVWGE